MNCQILGEGYRRAIRERQTTVTIQMRDACNQVSLWERNIEDILNVGMSMQRTASGRKCDCTQWNSSRCHSIVSYSQLP